jgi:hypothetical protein
VEEEKKKKGEHAVHTGRPHHKKMKNSLGKI